jgi:hypothetical protein
MGACSGICGPGQTNCSGNTTQTCGPTGNWVNQTACAQPSPDCAGGACTCASPKVVCGGTTCTNLSSDTNNCSACGDKCNLTNASSAGCTGTCNYICNAGYANCNKAAPNLNGCECATPACCGTSCQNTHNDGLGHHYYDCNTPGTFNSSQAIEACTAYALSVGGTAANCSDQWACPALGNTHYFVCYSTDGGLSCATYCWQYLAPEAGWVTSCTACNANSGNWN